MWVLRHDSSFAVKDSTTVNDSTPNVVLHGAYAISGAASGLGAAVADAIREAGGTPVVFDVRPPSASSRLPFYEVDVADSESVARAMRDTASRFGPLRGVVANAGIDACGKFEAIDTETWERVVRVNLFGVAAMVRAALQFLPTDGSGRIVTVASTLGLRALSDATAYCASKFGVVGFTRALSVELSGKAGVTLLIPGGMQTAFFDGREEQYRPAADAHLNAPSNVASAVVFALSQPRGCEIREMIVCPSGETSWP